MNRLDGAITWIENIAIGLASAMLAIMVLVQTYNVVLRYFFKAPVAWTYPFITNYLLEGLFFLALSWTLRTNGHIQLDVFSQHFNRKARKVAGVVANSIALLMFTTIGYLGAERTVEAFLDGDISPDSLQWPLWTSYLIVPAGTFIICLRLFYRIASVAPISEDAH